MRHDAFAGCVWNRRCALQHLRNRSRVQSGSLLVWKHVHDGMLYEFRRVRDPVGHGMRRARNGMSRL